MNKNNVKMETYAHAFHANCEGGGARGWERRVKEWLNGKQREFNYTELMAVYRCLRLNMYISLEYKFKEKMFMRSIAVKSWARCGHLWFCKIEILCFKCYFMDSFAGAQTNRSQSNTKLSVYINFPLIFMAMTINVRLFSIL